MGVALIKLLLSSFEVSLLTSESYLEFVNDFPLYPLGDKAHLCFGRGKLFRRKHS